MMRVKTTGSSHDSRITRAGALFILSVGAAGFAGHALANHGPANPYATLAESSVQGNASYQIGNATGLFTESDYSGSGALVAIDLKSKGYGYEAAAASDHGVLSTFADTHWVIGSGHGNNSGASSSSAEAVWSEWFVISGGTGEGTAHFTSFLDGVLDSVKGGSSGYALTISYLPESACQSNCTAAESAQSLLIMTGDLSGKAKSTLHLDLESDFSFEYGQPFSLTATLSAWGRNGGLADFSLSPLAQEVVLPNGATWMSAADYTVQPVPESDTYALMLLGIGLVGLAVRRAGQRHQILALH